MNIRKQPTEPTELDRAITAAHAVLDATPTYSDEYAKTVDQLAKLYAMRPQSSRVSLDTMAIVVGNIIIALTVVGYEQKAAVTSKFAQFLIKAKS